MLTVLHSRDVDTTPAATADPMVAMRTTYVETLLDRFAQANGEVDSELADRVERLMGFEQATPEGS